MPTIFFYFLKIIFRSAHQNDLKTSKTYYLKTKKKKKNFKFFENCFPTVMPNVLLMVLEEGLASI
jgi:IS4 transposase